MFSIGKITVAIAALLPSCATGLLLPPHSIIKAKRALDISPTGVLLKTLDGNIDTVDFAGNLIRRHRRVHGDLLQAKLTREGDIVQYVVDDEYHTIYVNDEVAVASCYPVNSYTVQGDWVLTIFKNHEVHLCNLATGEGRSLDFARVYQDFPTCAAIDGDTICVGTLTGSVVVMDKNLGTSGTKIKSSEQAATTAISVLQCGRRERTRGPQFDITVGYINKSIRKISFDVGRRRILFDTQYPVEFPKGDTFLIDTKVSPYFRTFTFLCGTSIIRNRISGKSAVLTPEHFTTSEKEIPLLADKVLALQINPKEVMVLNLKMQQM